MTRRLTFVFAFAVGVAAATYGGGPSCPGDCHNDGAVSADEIVTGIDIALGGGELATCPSFDVSGDQLVTVEEIVQGVNVAREGCQATATPTATVIPTPGAPSDARRAVGMIATSTQAFLALPDLLSALIDEVIDLPNARATQSSRRECPDGGDRTLNCEEALEGTPPMVQADYELDFDDCEFETDDDRVLVIDGRIKLSGPRGQRCGVIPEDEDFDFDIDQIEITSTGGALDTTTTFTDVDGDISFSERDAGCGFEQFDLRIDGDVLFEAQRRTGAPVTTIAAELDETKFRLHVDDYGLDCRPEDYTLKVNDDVTLTSDGVSLAVDYDDYVLEADAVGDGSSLRVRGALTSDCFGPKVSFVTDVDMHVGEDLGCPDAGQVSVSSDDGLGVIYYSADRVEIDRDGNGTRDESFSNCRDPALYQCPAGS